MNSQTASTRDGGALAWFVRGLMCLFTLPALILMGAFAGFAGIAHEAGFALAHVEFMVLMIWALPSKVVFISAVIGKSGFAATFVAVALSSIRLMPMTMAIVPEMKAQNTRSWVLYLLAHFVAVTGWVMALERFKSVPRNRRTAFFGGLVATLLLSNMFVVAITYGLVGAMPPVISAALVFVTPLYFLFSLWGSAREFSGRLSMVFGLLLTPLAHWLIPQGDVLVTGLLAGMAAYIVGKHRKRSLQ